MTTRDTQLVNPIVEVMSRWSGIDTMALLHSGSDRYDPYNFLSVDAYCSGEIPAPDVREAELRDQVAFESSPGARKDRFLIGETPIRIEYKDIRRFDAIVKTARSGLPDLRDAGTYPFYRLAAAEIVHEGTGWIRRVRDDLEKLPPVFWTRLRDNQVARAEHTYADLSAAAFRDDELFFVVSAGRFVRSIAGLLFTVNRRFQPSYRLLTDELARLEVLPGSFAARLETFVRQDGSITMEQRRELAELMITSVIAL